MEQRKPDALTAVLALYLLLFLFRLAEYFLLRTDQGLLGEAVFHKLAGIAVLLLACRRLGSTLGDIGFSVRGAVGGTLWGLLLGAGSFALAYCAELLVLAGRGMDPQLRFFVSSYAVEGNRALEGSLLLLLFCLLGNIINVVMEEGVFRGLFLSLLNRRHGFAIACALSSLLFGLWHIMQPLRSWADGGQTPAGAAATALVLVATSTLMGIQLCLLLRVTGALWMGMAAHFVNNTAVNLLHVAAGQGVDALQVLRISIAQTICFGVSLLLYCRGASRGWPKDNA